MRKNFKPCVRKFVEECLASGIASPSSMRDAFKEKFGMEKTTEAFIMAYKRLGISKEQRRAIASESQKHTEVKDISEYKEVRTYIVRSERAGITEVHLNRILKDMRTTWEWMDGTNPREWTEENIHECVKQHVPMIKDNRGRMQFEKPGKVRFLLTAVNTVFPGILQKGWSAGLNREPGELKDYFTFQEFDDFLRAVAATKKMPREGWTALYEAQVNMGCREGSLGKTGIVSLRWEDIDFTTKRCSLREKGGKGKAGRLWKNLPLDLFSWLEGWKALLRWHELCGQPAKGRVFPVRYEEYLEHFHETRKKCKGRIAGDSETMRPHVLRMTHAQWLVKMWVPIEQICGIFPDGYFGVGWDNPMILLKYYITLETEQRLKAETIMQERMKQLVVMLPSQHGKKQFLEKSCVYPTP